MPIKISCTTCGAALKAPDELQGKSVPCPKCKQPITVPALDQLADLEPLPDDGGMGGDPLAGFGGAQTGPPMGQQMGGQQMGGYGGQPQPFGGGGQQFGQAYGGGPRKKKNTTLFLGLGAGALVVIAAVVILIVVLTAGDSGAREPLAYMPANSSVIVQIKPAAIMQSGVYTQLSNNALIAGGAQSVINQMSMGSQVDVKEFLRNTASITMGTRAASGGASSAPPVVIALQFNRNYTIDEIATAEEQSKWKQQTVGGETVYQMDVPGGMGTQSMAMSLISPRLLLVGDMSEVSAALQRSGEAQLSPTVKALLDKADMNQHLVLAVKADENFRQGVAGAGGPQAEAAASSVSGFLMQASATNDLSLQMTALMTDAQAAQDMAAQANTALQETKSNGLPIPGMQLPGIEQAMQTIQVTANGTELDGKLVISQAALKEIETLMQAFGGLGGF